MIRKLLATTAIATLVATGAAMAQSTTPAPSTTQPMEAAPAPQVKQAEGHLASNIIGETVYNGTSDEADNIGEVNDLVLNDNGQIEAIVVGVGGFLGIGEKNVALEFDLIQWAEMDGDEYIVVETTREALEAQPDFDLAAYEFGPADVEVGNTKPATAEDLAAAPAQEEAAPADDMAQAPAEEEAARADDMAQAPAEEEAAPADDMAQAPAEEEAAPADDMAQAPADEEAAPADDMAQAPADEEAAPADDMAQAPADEAVTETDETQTAAIDRSTLKDVPAEEIRAENLIGTTVYGANEENVGEVGDIILTQDGKVDALIIDVGGFLGIGEKEVAISMENLAFMADEGGGMYLYTTFTEEQLEAQAEYDETTFADARDDQLLVQPAQ